MELKKNIPVFDIKNNKNQESLEGIFKIYQLKGNNNPAETFDCVPFRTNIPHRHSFYEICIFMQGQGNHEVDFINFPIKPESIHFIFPGQVHHIASHENSQGYVLAFSQDFYTYNYNLELLNELSYLSQKSAVFILNLPLSDFTEFVALLNLIKTEYIQSRPISPHIIRSFLHIFLLKGKYFYQRNVLTHHFHPNDQRIISKFHQSIEKNFCQKHLVKEYAEELSISVNQLNKVAKEITGKTASDLICDRVILEAKRHLTFSQLNNKEIAYSLGFQDPSYFSRFFRRKTGFSPSQFKQQLPEKYK